MFEVWCEPKIFQGQGFEGSGDTHFNLCLAGLVRFAVASGDRTRQDKGSLEVEAVTFGLCHKKKNDISHWRTVIFMLESSVFVKLVYSKYWPLNFEYKQ